MTPQLTQEQAVSALGDLLTAILTDGVEIVQGQVNRVPMPASGNFVLMTVLRREQMSTTTHDYAPPSDPIPAIGSEDVERSTALHLQVDIYGPDAGDNAQIINALVRDEWGVTFLKDRHIAPLYCEDARQMPLVAGEQQYIQRWIMPVAIQANVAVTVPMEFADSLITTLDKGD